MTTALPIGVAVGAGFATVPLTIALNTLMLLYLTRALTFAGALHDTFPFFFNYQIIPLHPSHALLLSPATAHYLTVGVSKRRATTFILKRLQQHRLFVLPVTHPLCSHICI